MTRGDPTNDNPIRDWDTAPRLCCTHSTFDPTAPGAMRSCRSDARVMVRVRGGQQGKPAKWVPRCGKHDGHMRNVRPQSRPIRAGDAQEGGTE